MSQLSRAVGKVLVVGGGIAGMCAAIQLRKLGAAVDLAEIDSDWRPAGTGITLLGPTLRAFTEIGVIDAIMQRGWCADGVDMYGGGGEKLGQMPTRRIGREDVPGGGGILRPVLADILREATLASGTSVHLGSTVKALQDDGRNVSVDLTDGYHQTYDLVVGADGLRSEIRARTFPDAPKPQYTGQGSWRVVVPRAETVERPAMFMGATIKAGLNPVSPDEMYLFVTEPRQSPEHLDSGALPETLRSLLGEFGGVIAQVREGLTHRSPIIYRPFWALLMPLPWHSGRTVLIGDAVHATTPHLASGAGLGVEDAIVLAQELAKTREVEEALTAFEHRRFERCRMVVENSLQLGRMESLQGSKEAHSQLMRNSMVELQAQF
jgi:2-polyprenyl-6-methoxyphenol hydroxylase-like FAD-dependent oxidoreductase